MNTETSALLQRIITDPDVLGGKPIIRGTRISVELILGLLANEAPVAEILDDYPWITDADIRACLAFAQRAIEDFAYVPLAAGA